MEFTLTKTTSVALTLSQSEWIHSKMRHLLAGASTSGVFVCCSGARLLCRKHQLQALSDDLFCFSLFDGRHAWAGAATMALWISTVVVGGMFLHPDYGCLKQNGTVRFVHRNSGTRMMRCAPCIMNALFFQFKISQLTLPIVGNGCVHDRGGGDPVVTFCVRARVERNAWLCAQHAIRFLGCRNPGWAPGGVLSSSAQKTIVKFLLCVKS